jgi:signal transduction histidine kinase
VVRVGVPYRVSPVARVRAPFVAVTAVSATITVAVALIPGLDYTYHREALHVALESGGSLVAILAAFLVFGRLRLDARLDEALLLCGLCLLVGTNFAYGVVLDSTTATRGTAAIWAALIGRTLGCALIATAAFLPPRTLRQPRRWATASVLASLALFLAVGAFVAAFRAALPSGVSVLLPPAPSGRPHLSADPALLALQWTAAVLYGAAAVAFERRSRRNRDELSRWLALACVLASFSHLNYFLYPSLFSDWVSVGDLFRTAFFAALLCGALREIASYWQAAANAAALEERQRIARDLHDGLAQEIAFIRRNVPLLNEVDAERDLPDRLTAAAERAHRETRQVIEALSRPENEPLEQLLERMLRETAARHGAQIEIRVAPGIALDPIRSEALLRVASEAVTNAATHSGAASVSVQLDRRGRHTHLRVSDKGRGFDPQAVVLADHFGLVSMRQRAASIGAELSIRTHPGRGTTVRLAL